ncbi:hypothetical protein DICSQDRAFT_103972 [Dichomitus squalens LYAD-421 SS1]|uniref:uncharacterized protein n=1 Tax=Dichomitus squalens (strain LYAD-421) TaxID=732165 RepID=UPI0004415A41|nr:uncharacterized protein DICSQDRAFT_103972 [Dichomitus squalens LYAD-421 SS1]EJF62555.1 hypothetical protein DICSQDRAFT_103972 [Dichomitus squalens LYAD-421 SS1]
MTHNREWDKGKQADYGGWQPPPRSNGHMRDDDWYGGDAGGNFKRRKYNDGGYDQSQGWDDSGYDQGSSYQDDRYHKGGGGMYNKKRLVPSEPSPHVIFLGLDPDFTESDMQAYLTSNKCSIESVTIIRDRSTGVSKGFGFAQFTTTEHARAFVDPLFPFIQIPPPASHGATARAAFYRAVEQNIPQPPGGRRVKIDYSQSAAPGERRGPKGTLQSNDGTRDIGNVQAPVLLFRGLDPLSGPQAIAQAMKLSAGPGKEGAKGMRRIILIKDKVTTASWGFAFVEFVDIQSASAVLASTMSPQLHPNGFRISDRPVAASFAHPYSFQPIPDYSLRDEACVMATSTLGGVEGVWVRYWDEASTAAVLEFTVEEEAPSTSATPAPKEKKEKKKKDTTQETSVEASALPVSDKPVTLSFKGGLSIAKPGPAGPSKKAVPLSQAFSMDDAAEGEGDATTTDATATEDPKVAASKRVAPLIASKKTVNNINKWNQVQDVLHHDAPQEVPATQPVETPAPVAPVAATQPAAVKASTLTETAETEFEFSDTKAMICLLCARQFKSLDQLKRHNKESDLHKKNFKDAALREVAREKVRAARAKAEAQQPKYRDRASERRVMHNQPDVPRPSSDDKPVAKRKHSEGPPPPEPPPAPPVNPGKDESNIGNKLLKMMGWKEGQGLGTEGEGRVDPIQTALYAAGAGLGATKPKDITKLASDYTGYVNLAKDAARERYGS